MRLFNNSNASLILAIFNNLGLKSERVSASTENEPVYNVIQLAFKQLQMTPRNFQSIKSAPQMLERNQHSFNSNTLQILIATMNE